MNSRTDPQSNEFLIEIESEAYLDNVVWSSLTGAHSELAQRNGSALRYRPEFAPFGAAEDYTYDRVAQIAGMLLPMERVALVSTNRPEVPPGYDVVLEGRVLQMIAGRHLRSVDEGTVIRRLGIEDVESMLRLVQLTEPGPFSARTYEMGTYFGIKEGTQLVAMAGERMVARDYVEVSAVCTHPGWRGRGLGRLLMEHLCMSIQQRGVFRFSMFSATTHLPSGFTRNSDFRTHAAYASLRSCALVSRPVDSLSDHGFLPHRCMSELASQYIRHRFVRRRPNVAAR
ncbi:FR47 domain-containing protein [Caballeronia arationis]|jgi:ribosomal protein S18 acetylase RimI-like enzyme|uniref:FR47-like protein n=1 Tax=Caballeronia arationis TaxID=1777142 RepID=A0A7Z7I4R1_9BURK|nr:GNAT family N-acetyltransferase [Caballeronia arationis]SAK83019.1 FR47 domain-containing protein [Caballeronia arationis]SOE62627.1 FR47-like protein [Caballeronia arationis]